MMQTNDPRRKKELSSYFGMHPILERVFVSIWLVFALAQVQVLFPLRVDFLWKAGALALLLAFLTISLVLIWRNPSTRRHVRVVDLCLLSLLVIITISINFVYGSAWMLLFFFIGNNAGLRLPIHLGKWVVSGIAVMALVTGLLLHAGWSAIALTIFVDFGLGFCMFGFVHLGNTIQELRNARERIAQLASSEAIAEERLRFARDLHDLLGHSLSLITIKSELSSRMLDIDPGRAKREMQEVEAVAREALREVRQVVVNYRQPTLMTELEGAKELLAAAGIRCHIEYRFEILPQAVDAVLAWTIREAVTNTIRHARASFCEIEIKRSGPVMTAQVRNDGCKPQSAPKQSPLTQTGTGLVGIAERVKNIQGELTAGPVEASCFRLQVSIPLASNPEEGG